jgi:hypothetical protein
VYLFSPLTPLVLSITLMAGTIAAQQATFPKLIAKNLEGKAMTLPTEFPGELNLVLITFEQDHRREADGWLEAAPELFKKYPGIPFFEVAVLGKEYKLARFVIDRAMRNGIANPDRRARTVTLYNDKARFDQALQIKNEQKTVVLLVDRKGKILWREQGIYHDLKGNSLKATLAALREPVR